MASIRKRGPYQWQALVRRDGWKSCTRTFETRQDAQDWAAGVEADMRRGVFVDRSQAERLTLGDILERYRKEETPKKRGRRVELSRLKRLMERPIAARRLTDLRAADITAYRNQRLKSVSGKTVREELLLISVVLNVARREWSIPVENCVREVRKPRPGQARDRRLRGDEEERLLEAARNSKAPGLECALILAIETGMRRGEIAGLGSTQVDFDAKVIRLELTKNGERRSVPLSERAEAALRSLGLPKAGPLFSFYDSNGLGAAYVRARERAGISGLRFHDLRHEAASRLAPRMPATVLAKVMGWKSIQMAMRYYNPTEQELVAVIRAAA